MGNCCCTPKKLASQAPTPTSPPATIPIIINDFAQEEPAPVLLRAMYNYRPQGKDDLQFLKGDILELIEKSTDIWWIAINRKTGMKGYVPVNYIRLVDETPQSHDCFFDIQRRDAERMLLSPGSKLGQFLVRPARRGGCFALCIRGVDPIRGVPAVKHYLIRSLDQGRGYYISSQRQFEQFKQLIEYYKSNQEGLCTCLTDPCPRAYTPPPFHEFEIDRRFIQFGDLLGSGYFGEVYQAKFNDVIDVAVKTLKSGTMSPQWFIKEAQMMHQLNHPKIVRLLGVCTNAEPMYILTELMPNGALLSYLKSHASARDLSFADSIDIGSQISDGMAYLEAKQIVHRDLRAANILVGENKEVKVADFGLTTILKDVSTCDDNVKFPVRWTAPEAMFHRQFSIKSDVWSFGVLLYEVVTYGELPYADMLNRQVMEFVQSGRCLPNPHNPAAGIFCPPELYDQVMMLCWKFDAKQRPTFTFLHETLDDFSSATEKKYDLGEVASEPLLNANTDGMMNVNSRRVPFKSSQLQQYKRRENCIGNSSRNSYNARLNTSSDTAKLIISEESPRLIPACPLPGSRSSFR